MQGYLARNGIARIKSKLTNEIFKQEMLCLYEQKSNSRDELVHEVRQAVSMIRANPCNYPDIEMLMHKLAQRLETVRGKKLYGYLPKDMKKIVDEIVNQLERLPVVAAS